MTKTSGYPNVLRGFTARFTIETLKCVGLEQTVEEAVRTRTPKEKKQLLDFFQEAITKPISARTIGEIWGSDEMYVSIRTETIGSFLGMIIETLETSIASDKEASKRRWSRTFARSGGDRP